jgi:1-acyl-sn-glycerol-3-phosphate acyltransferase
MSTKKKKKTIPRIEGDKKFRALLKGFFWLVGRIFYRFSYAGIENVPPEGAFILAANHTSIVDIIAIHTKLKRWLHWVAKKELFDAPVVGFVMPRMGAIPVDRDRVDLTAARGIFSILQEGRPVAMFPQGTRLKQEDINRVPPKSGIAHFAVKTNALILPVAIEGRFRLFRKTKIIIGEPFRLDADIRKKYNQQELLEMTVEVMSRIYALTSFEYKPEYNVTVERE